MSIITEEQVKEALNKVLLNESQKVKRDEFNKIQFKIDELQNSLNETIKELRKLEECVPYSLQTITRGRIQNIELNLGAAQKLIVQLKEKIKQHKRNLFNQRLIEKSS